VEVADHVATAETTIEAPASVVWAALTDPELIKQYMFGSEVQTDWKQGSPIVWKGEYEGATYQDKGEILEIEPGKRLKVTHFSPMSGQADVPENYHTVSYDLTESGDTTNVRLSQDGNASDDEAERSRANWEAMLTSLKSVVEDTNRE
jgi:uncharacterized protein YndB with AHSA1/START domain